MNTSLAGSRSSWPANHASRRFRISGLSCSAACADFYGMARPSFQRRSLAVGLRRRTGYGDDNAVLGIDLGKNVCSLVGVDSSGTVVLRRRVKRETLIGLAAKLPPCVVAMEACCGAHHVGRVFAARGHEIRLMSPEYVRPYVKAQERRPRRGGHRRGGDASDHAVRRAEEPRSARHSDFAQSRESDWLASGRR